MLLLILSIFAIIGLLISSVKAIRYLRKENISSAKTWFFLALAILIIYSLVAWVYGKMTAKPLTGNSVFSFGSDDWKDGDYVRITFWKNEYLSQVFNPTNVPEGMAVSPPAPIVVPEIQGWINKLPTKEQGYESDGGIILGYVTVLGRNGVDKGETYIIPKSIVKSIRKTERPVEG